MVNNSRVSLRPQMADLPSYVPGARTAPGAAAFRLSSNENPYPPPAAVLAAIADAAADANRYPDMYATGLCAAIGELCGVEPERVVVGNGSIAVLGHILSAVIRPGDEVVYPWRSFEAYPIAVAVAGGTAVRVPLASNSPGHLDLSAVARAITDRTRVILICTPNNPTGPAVHRRDLSRFLAAVPSGVLVVLDEAYAEFVRDPDAADGLRAHAKRANVVVLRTLSKAYGLAGLRIGYAVARPRLARGIRAVSTPFGVSEIAQRAGIAALSVRADLLERVDRLVAERTRVTGLLRDQGWDIPDPQGNFVWLALGERTTARADDARAAGLLVRPFAREGIRVTIGETEANDAFVRLARRWR